MVKNLKPYFKINDKPTKNIIKIYSKQKMDKTKFSRQKLKPNILYLKINI